MTALIFSHKDISPQLWDNFILASPQASIFALYEYMQIISPHWEAVIICEGERWRAVMPFSSQKKWGFSFALQPILAQYWGVFFENNSYKNDYEAFSHYRKILISIIEKLPKCHLFAYQFAPNFPYPIPFKQAGYTLLTRYTYHLALQKTEKELWSNLASPLQRQIKKTYKQNVFLNINKATDIKDIVAIFRQNKDTGKELNRLK